jgi:hypothetical protein
MLQWFYQRKIIGREGCKIQSQEQRNKVCNIPKILSALVYELGVSFGVLWNAAMNVILEKCPTKKAWSSVVTPMLDPV